MIAGLREIVEARQIDLAREAGAGGEVHEVAGPGGGALVVRPEEVGALAAARDGEQRLLEVGRRQHPRQELGLARADVRDRHVDEHGIARRVAGLLRRDVDAELGPRGGGERIGGLGQLIPRLSGPRIVGVTGRTCLKEASEEHERDAAG